MIYLVEFTEWSGSENNWNRDYRESILQTLTEMEVPCQLISGKFENEVMKSLLSLPRKSIVWFIMSVNKYAKVLKERRPDLFLIGHSHSTALMWGEPCYVHSISELYSKTMEEAEYDREVGYDLILCNSQYHKQHMVRKDICLVTGFPIRSSRVRSDAVRKMGKVIVSQSFRLDKDFYLTLLIARKLIELGYEVEWTMGGVTGDLKMFSDIVELAKNTGITFSVNGTKQEYYDKVAGAEFMLTVPTVETLSLCTVEAILLGTKVIVPDSLCFPEYVPEENRYEPYSIRSVVDTLNTATAGTFLQEMWNPNTIVEKVLTYVKVNREGRI